MLATIIAQLCQDIQRIPPDVLAIYQANYFQPNIPALLAMFRTLIPEFKKIFIILGTTGKLSTSYSDKSIKSVCQSQLVDTPAPPINSLMLS